MVRKKQVDPTVSIFLILAAFCRTQQFVTWIKNIFIYYKYAGIMMKINV